MPRTVTALYDIRAEAETARARLASEVNATSTRIIGKDTIGALDGLKIAAQDVHSYREGIDRGGYLLTAEVESGQDPERIRVLEQSASVDMTRRESQWSSEGWRGLDGEKTVAEERIPQVHEELRIGKREVSRGGAKVRSFTREVPVDEDVTLRQERVEIENRSTERRLTQAEIEQSGLLKDRVIEVSEMREEAVVTKDAVVREEVVVKKAIEERTETIRDTVRRTEVEVEELPGSGERSATGGKTADRGRQTNNR